MARKQCAMVNWASGASPGSPEDAREILRTWSTNVSRALGLHTGSGLDQKVTLSDFRLIYRMSTDEHPLFCLLEVCTLQGGVGYGSAVGGQA